MLKLNKVNRWCSFPMALRDLVNNLLFVQISSIKPDVCLHNFWEHRNISIVCYFYFFMDSFNQIIHQLWTNMLLLGVTYHQIESNWRWYMKPESTVVAGKLFYLLLQSCLQYSFTCGGRTRFLIIYYTRRIVHASRGGDLRQQCTFEHVII